MKSVRTTFVNLSYLRLLHSKNLGFELLKVQAGKTDQNRSILSDRSIGVAQWMLAGDLS